MWRRDIRNKLSALFVLALLMTSGRISAHHSIAATYFGDQTQQIKGRIVMLIYRNPHSFVEVDANDEKGKKQTWAVEWAASSQLDMFGVKEALKPGDSVTVVGNPGRNPADHRLRLVKVTRTSNGWTWSGSF
jgi:hypothetical protein